MLVSAKRFLHVALANSGFRMASPMSLHESIRDSKELRRSLVAKLEPGLKYVDGEIEGVVIRALRFFHVQRGWLIETFRHDELDKDCWPTMMYVSSTLPGVARGPHEHVDQTDGFAFIGPSDFRLYLWDSRPDGKTRGHRAVITVGASNPAAVWIPPGVVHAYRN